MPRSVGHFVKGTLKLDRGRLKLQALLSAELHAPAERNGLVADDGQRQFWATIRSGLGAGLQQPVDLDADRHSPSR